jgi:beta-1,4-mannosyltransferase
MAGPDKRISLKLERLTDEQLSDEIVDASGVVLPYQNMVNSGAALLALSHSVPILVPLTQTTSDLRAEVGKDWVSVFEGEITVQALREFSASIRSRCPSSAPALQARDWESIGMKHAAVYRDLEARA